jgi:hypothetical protein
MTDNESLDREPDKAESDSLPVVIKTRQPFARLRRELSEEELGSAAVQRLLLDEVERLERQVIELKSYEDHYHALDKRAAILEQHVKKSLASEIIFGVCLCVGAAAVGYAPAVWNHQPSGYLSIVFGLILIIGGTISRLVQR